MKKEVIINIFRYLYKNPTHIFLLAKKVIARIKEINNNADLLWLQKQEVDFNDWAANVNPLLWEESIQFADTLSINAKKKLELLPFKMGGGGLYSILYFVTRYYQPLTIVETGVAAGFSSQALLSAIDINMRGALFSSDFPYFRLPNPEKYIGILVDDDLRANWKLYTDGDVVNLPIILSQIDSIDLFHYDSDKSYSGRDMAWTLVQDKMHAKSLIIFDDIQDNNYFKDFVQKHDCKYYVFKFQNKFIGFIYELNR